MRRLFTALAALAALWAVGSMLESLYFAFSSHRMIHSPATSMDMYEILNEARTARAVGAVVWLVFSITSIGWLLELVKKNKKINTNKRVRKKSDWTTGI